MATVVRPKARIVRREKLMVSLFSVTSFDSSSVSISEEKESVDIADILLLFMPARGLR